MQREHEKHGWGRSQGSLELHNQHYNSLNKPRSATLNTGSASIRNGLRNPYSKSRIHLDHSPWATPHYWFLEHCFPPAKIPMPSFVPCFSYVFLTNPTDFHSSSNLSLTPTLFKHQTVTICKNSDYGQEAPRLESYLKSWKNKRPDTLPPGTPLQGMVMGCSSEASVRNYGAKHLSSWKWSEVLSEGEK